MSSTVVSAGVPKQTNKKSTSAFKVQSLMKELIVFVCNINLLILSSAFILSHQHTILFSCPMILLMFFPLLQISSPVFSMGSPRHKLRCLVSVLKRREKFSSQRKRPTSSKVHSRSGRTPGLLVNSRSGETEFSKD